MRWFVVLVAFLFSSCSCNQNRRAGVFRIGVDPTYAPLNFEELQPYVSGYVEEVLLDVARFSGMKFEKITANWDHLLEGMDRGQYDVVLSSMPAYNFNLAKYEFSESFLELGPVVVVSSEARYSDLKSLSGELVGVIVGDPAVLVIEPYPAVIVRNYNTIPDLLNAVMRGDLQAAVVDRLSAASYVRDLYAGSLKISTVPLTPLGLRMMGLKGKTDRFTRLFNHALEQMKKKKTLDALQKKWNL